MKWIRIWRINNSTEFLRIFVCFMVSKIFIQKLVLKKTTTNRSRATPVSSIEPKLVAIPANSLYSLTHSCLLFEAKWSNITHYTANALNTDNHWKLYTVITRCNIVKEVLPFLVLGKPVLNASAGLKTYKDDIILSYKLKGLLVNIFDSSSWTSRSGSRLLPSRCLDVCDG